MIYLDPFNSQFHPWGWRLHKKAEHRLIAVYFNSIPRALFWRMWVANFCLHVSSLAPRSKQKAGTYHSSLNQILVKLQCDIGRSLSLSCIAMLKMIDD